MIKAVTRTYLLTAFLASVTGSTFAQHYTDQLLSHKILLNLDQVNIEAYAKPVKNFPVEPDKQYWWFSGKSIQTTQGGYSGKLLNGAYRETYLNKNIKSLGYIDKGLKAGIWKDWYENGKLKADYTWYYGKKNGIYHKYDSLGVVTETGKYKNDVLQVKPVITVKEAKRPGWFSRFFSKKKRAKS